MSSHRSAMACAADIRPRLGSGESAVIIVIIVMAMLATTRDIPLQEVVTVLGSSGLLGVLLIRCTRTGLPAAVLRRAGRVLLAPAQG
ncbi:hypothetical protein ACFC34_37970 [Streptomyces sp. NPDC056053]|uniref:hypothetical protein n=1 Tax=Streptomyces sp. NPDC056053 TaxID=3345696 RepID=UPI0035DA6F31